MKKQFFGYFLMAISLFSFSTGYSQKVKLELNLAKGLTYDEEISIKQNITTQMMPGFDQEIKNDTRLFITTTSKGQNADGNFTIVQHTDRMLLDMEMMGQLINIDTDGDVPSSPMQKQIYDQIKPMVNIDIMVTLDKQGNTLDLTMDETVRKQIEQYAGSMTDNGYSNLPGKAVKVGDTWNVSTTKDANGVSVVTEITYTLKSVNNGIAYVNLEGIVKSGINLDNNDDESAKVKKGTISGKAEIDIATGLYKMTDVDSDIEMTITNSGMEIPVKINQKMSRIIKI